MGTRRAAIWGLLAAAAPAFAGPASGTYAGDGTASRAITAVGFNPTFLIIKGDTLVPAVAHTASMGAVSKELYQNTAADAGRILSTDPLGFTVSADSAVNAVGTNYTWIAFADGGGDLTEGAYTGNGASSQDVTVGFPPLVVFVMPASADYPVWATIPMDGGTSFFSSQTLQPNMILAMLDGGFRVGSDPAVNRAGVTYYYVAGRDDPRVIQAGSYLGNGSASRVIQTAMSSALTYAVVKGEGRATVQRPTALTGNASLFFGAFANDLNAILELDAGTFTIGKSVQTNDAGVLYWWFAVSAFDAGSVDGGSGDGGLNDAGATDAGAVDAGVDSGTADAGGAPEPDAGQGAGNFGIGCGCGSSGGPPLGFFALIAWAACNRRRARAY